MAMETRTTAARKPTKVATPWGSAALVEEVTLAQRAGDRRFASLVQLLETEKGERLVRFAYSTNGVSRRGPVTLRARDLERLRAALSEHPALAEALRLGGEA
jgi:hypothetical protein